MCRFTRRGLLIFALSAFLFAFFRPLSVAEAAWSGGVASNFAGGDGSEDNPYQIATPEELALLAESVNAGTSADRHYLLTGDIDLGLVDWTPIGAGEVDFDLDELDASTAAPFEGVFDGGGWTISSLKIESAVNDFAGLFGVVSGDEAKGIKNLIIVDPDILAISFIGGLAGHIGGVGPAISNIIVRGGIISGDAYVGGLAGWSAGNVVSSSAACSVTGLYEVGGLVGWNAGTVTSSYATGSVSGTAEVGGLVGWNNGGTITSSYATGPVSGDDHVGGLAGWNDGDIASSYAVGSVDGSLYVGGLAGQNGGSITSSYTTGPVGGGDFAGGLTGWNEGSIVLSYAAGSTSGSGEVGGLVGDNEGGTITSGAYDPQGTGMPESEKIGVDNNDQSGNIASIPTMSGDWQSVSLWSAASWDVTPAYYPQLKSFADSASPDIKGWSALSAVPVIFSGGEDAHNVKTPFALLSEDAEGGALTWRIDGAGAVLVASGGLFVLSPDEAGKSFDLVAVGGGGREKTFRLTTAASLSPGPGPGPGPIPNPPYYNNADIRGVSIAIDGVGYSFTLQPDGMTWVATVPHGFDLSSVASDIRLWPGAVVSPEPPYDFRQAVEVEVTAPDGRTKKNYRLIVNSEAPPVVEESILDALPDNARALLVQNDDGTWTVEIVFPFDTGFDPSEIGSITVEARGITGIRVYYVDENGDEIRLDSSTDSLRTAGGERLKIVGTAANRAALESARIVRVTVSKKNDAATYYQVLDMPLSLIPGGTPPIDPVEPEPAGGSSGGCNAGTGMVLCGAALVLAVKRRK